MSLFLNNNVGYTIVGNPTIIRGILFNTDIDNYIKTTSQIDFSTEFNLEFYVRFKTPSSSVNGFHTIISTGDLDSPLLAVTTNGGYYYLVGYGEDLYRVQLTYDTYYRVKLVRKNETVWQTSIYNDDGRLLRTSPEKTKSITYTNKNILFGCPYGPANPVIPEIILKDCYIKVNNITWFNGKQTTSTSIQDIKFNNNIGYTTIGTPTISDGIASNFSNGNYIKLQSNIPIITSFEENVRFKITQDCAGKSLLSYSTTYNSNNLEGNINISNNLDSINVSLFIKYDGTYEAYSIQYNFSQHLNKYFTFKVYTDLSNVYLYLYDENNTLVGTNTYTNINLAGIIDNNKILIGNIYDESDYWPSEIDLNNTYIKFNGVTWFNGKEQTSIDVDYLALNNDIIWIKNPFNKPADWSDIRLDCPANSIALYAAHKADFSQYDNLGFTATCTGGYNVFIDGVQYGTTYASNAQCNITWSTSGITTGDDITTPSALKSHKIWVEPATVGNNITSFSLVKVGDDNNKGTLWVHFNLINNITFSEAFKVCDLLTAITAEKNILNVNYLYTAFQNCPLLEYLPIINGAVNNINADNFISSCNSITSITLKNSDKFNIGRGGSSANLKKIKADKHLYITQPNYLFYNCPKLEDIPSLQFINNMTSADSVLRYDKSLKPFDIDIRNCTSATKFVCCGENASTMLNLKSFRVSNEAPFNHATPPQINVSYTGMDRNALVQLFNDLPYNVGYEVFGSPTINNGVASGFSSSNYLNIPYSQLDLRNIVFHCKFKTGNDITTNQSILQFGNTGGVLPFLLWVSGNKLTIFHAGKYTSNNIYTTLNDNLSTNTDYEAEFGTVNSVRYFKFGTVGNMIDIPLTQGTDEDWNGTLSRILWIGNAGSAVTTPFTGSIDLNNTYIKINNVYWFRGQPAMIKTLSCVGATGTANLTQDDKDIALNKGWSLTLS